MNGKEEDTKIYTILVSSTKQELSLGIPLGEEPPPKIRLYHGNSSIAVFSFNKRSDSYIELSKDELEKFDRALKSKECRHFESISRESGDERLDKRLAKLQRRLRERNHGDQCPYCEEFSGVVNIEVDPSGSVATGNDVKIQADDLKVSEPQVKSLGSSSVQISWEQSFVNNKHLADCVFELQMSKSKNSAFQNVYSGPEQSFIKSDLLPGTKYYFRLSASKLSVKGPFSPDVFIVTDATAPCTPDIPHISNKTRTALGLKWTIKSDNGSPITSYVLQWDKGNNDGQYENIYEGKEKQYKFNHKFPPKTTYRFRIKAINKIGESEFSPELHYTSSAGVPSTPDPPFLVKATACSLQLSWKKPNTNGAEITEYILQMDDAYKGYGFLPVFRGLAQSCIVEDNLKRNTPYKFRLSAINVQGESKWSDIVSFSTKCEAPGRMLPPILEGKVHTKSFVVSWVAPSDDGGSEIVSYSLEVSQGKGGSFHDVYTGLDTTFKFHDLLPGHTYNVRVSCSTSEFQSPWSEATSVKTSPVIPDPPSAPRQAKNRKEQAHVIEMEWDIPSYDGGARITNYNAQMKAAGDQDFRHVYLGPKTCCRASGLQTNSQYSFRVRAQNVAGESKFSEISTLNTGPGAPDAVAKLEVICRSSNAVHISWKVPKTNGTVVTCYVLECARDQNGPFEKIYEGAISKYEMKKNVLPSTVYFFRIQACSDAGCSAWSDLSSCQTFAAPPAQVENLKLISRSATSLTIEWKIPHNNGAAITSYNIDVNGRTMQSCLPEKPENINNSTGDDTAVYTISELQANTQYRLRVQGVNKSGCGTFSSVISVTTGKIPPAAPVLDMVNCSYQSIKLRWSFGRSQSEVSDLTYELQMRSNETSFETVFKSSTTSHKVSKLQERTMYSFRIRAANEAGYGWYSKILMCQTAIQPPAVVKGLAYAHLTNTGATIVWKNVPVVEASDRITYILLGKRKENGKSEQLYEGDQTSFTYNDVIPEKTYTFEVSAVRTLANGTKTQGPFCPILTLTIPSALTQTMPNTPENQDRQENVSQPRELSEKQLTGILFIGFAFAVLLISLFVFLFVS